MDMARRFEELHIRPDATDLADVKLNSCDVRPTSGAS
jgi:hypothetical protein